MTLEELNAILGDRAIKSLDLINAPINITNDTLLIYATRCDDKLVEPILKLKGDPFISDSYNNSPISIALIWGKEKMVKLFIATKIAEHPSLQQVINHKGADFYEYIAASHMQSK